jgi:hypothetical protein
MCRSFATIVLLAACATSTRASLRASDPTFVPAPGLTPAVYTSARAAEIPADARRSVGLVEVHADTEAQAAELASAKGREIGCWMLIEHTVFEHRGAELADGGRIYLAHGGPQLPPRVKPPKTQYQFDCIVRGPRATLATSP